MIGLRLASPSTASIMPSTPLALIPSFLPPSSSSLLLRPSYLSRSAALFAPNSPNIHLGTLQAFIRPGRRSPAHASPMTQPSAAGGNEWGNCDSATCAAITYVVDLLLRMIPTVSAYPADGFVL